MIEGETNTKLCASLIELSTTHTELLACTVFLPSELALQKEFLELYFHQEGWGFPHSIGAAEQYPHQQLY